MDECYKITSHNLGKIKVMLKKVHKIPRKITKKIKIITKNGCGIIRSVVLC
jgi:hypothetical protein